MIHQAVKARYAVHLLNTDARLAGPWYQPGFCILLALSQQLHGRYRFSWRLLWRLERLRNARL